jgi:hypothetical protein
VSFLAGAVAALVVATHIGSCVIYPSAAPVAPPPDDSRVETAGVIASLETRDGLVATLVDGRVVAIDGARRYALGEAPRPGDLLLIATAADGDSLLGAVPFNEDEGCYLAYSPALVDGDGVVLGGGLRVAVEPDATDQEVLEYGEGTPEDRPLVPGVTFYTHDGMCLSSSGVATRVVRGIYTRDSLETDAEPSTS